MKFVRKYSLGTLISRYNNINVLNTIELILATRHVDDVCLLNDALSML